MNFLERLTSARVIETRCATSAGTFLPFTVLPAKYSGKVAIVPLTDEEAAFLGGSRLAHDTFTDSQVGPAEKD